MNTYGGEPQSQKQGGENMKAKDDFEDLFLPGGFDSFGGMPEPVNTNMGQMNAGMEQLGSVDYQNTYGTVDNSYSSSLWSKPVTILNFKEQIMNSFMPFKYDRYKGISEGAAKEFVKDFTRLYLRVGFLTLALILLVGLGRSLYGSGVLMLAVIFGISYVISVFLEPYIFRFRAFIYRVIFGNLIMAITKTDITSTDMYLVSIYAWVPCMVISILMAFIIGLAYFSFPMLIYVIAAVAEAISIVQWVLPAVIMAIAIPQMK